MIKATWMAAVFAVAATVQLAVPVGMIVQREATLRQGRAYKFRTRPVDPSDAFRGRYVWLGFEQDHAPWHGDALPVQGRKAYALIEESRDGYAVVQALTAKPPTTGEYLEVRVGYPGWGTNSGSTYFTLPFDRYYMEEGKAPAAERAYWQHQNRRGQTNENTYAVVRIRNGDSVLENLYVGGKPIAELRHADAADRGK
jgi:GDYXXLXY motif protein